MSHLRLKKRFEEILSEGRGRQLLWLIAFILIVYLVFWGIIVFLFRDRSLGWQELISLFLDPGSFGGAGAHDAFRLVATLLGVFLFSALLVSVVSNIFENIAESFRNGYTRHVHKQHILILGGGNQLISIISALLENGAPYKSSDIVVLTQTSVKELREKLFTQPFLDGQKKKELSRRLSLYCGNRNNENELRHKNLAKDALAIYIIGEDIEIDHDSVSIQCCEKLKKICSDCGRIIKCFMVLRDQASIDVYKYVQSAENSEGSDLRVDIIDANEYIAEQVFVEDHDGKDVSVVYPHFDYRAIEKDGDRFRVVQGIRATDVNYVHLVIVGFSDMARSIARTAAHICHFPNFENGRRRTIITFIDSDMRSKMDCFVNSLSNLFKLSHYRYIHFDSSGHEIEEKHEPDASFGDFLDIEWEFVNADVFTPGAVKMLEALSQDSSRSLNLVIAKDAQAENTFLALHLPKTVYEKGYPIFVHQQDYGDVLKRARATRQFGNLYVFGMASDIQDDPLFICRTTRGQRVNFIYDQAYVRPKHNDEESAWFSIREAHKFSSIYCANAMTVRARSFELSEKHTVADLSAEQRTSIYEVEHRRWMVSELLLGYAPMNKSYLAKWKEQRMSTDEAVKKSAKAEFKKQKDDFYVHYDITPYSDLTPEEQVKDKIIIDEIANILR